MAQEQGKRPRILIVENAIAVTGSVESVLRSSVRLSPTFEFIFLLPNGSMARPHLEKNRFRVVEMPMRELRFNLVSLLVYLPALMLNTVRFRKILTDLDIDLIHSNDFYNLIPAFYKIFGGNKPYVCSMRFMPSRFPRIYLNSLLFIHRIWSSSIMAVSKAVLSQLTNHTKVEVIYDGLPLEETEYENDIPGVILCPANFTRGKGQEYALQAFSKLASSFAQWRLRFVGGTLGLKKNVLFKEELEDMSRALAISSRVDWAAFSENMREEYRAAAIVVNFSESESFSLVCQESLFFGRAVLSTDCGGPSEIIDNGVTGLLVPVGDVRAMGDAMKALMSDAGLRRKFSMNGRNNVRLKFGPETTIDKLSRCYFAALNQVKISNHS